MMWLYGSLMALIARWISGARTHDPDVRHRTDDYLDQSREKAIRMVFLNWYWSGRYR